MSLNSPSGVFKQIVRDASSVFIFVQVPGYLRRNSRNRESFYPRNFLPLKYSCLNITDLHLFFMLLGRDDPGALLISSYRSIFFFWVSFVEIDGSESSFPGFITYQWVNLHFLWEPWFGPLKTIWSSHRCGLLVPQMYFTSLYPLKEIMVLIKSFLFCRMQ